MFQILFLAASLIVNSTPVWAFTAAPLISARTTSLACYKECKDTETIDDYSSRRTLLQVAGATFFSALILPVSPASAEEKSFIPGGTLVDSEVGVTVGNPQASKSRNPDNSNVVFTRDYYYVLGTAAPWIENGSTEFPKTMPFTPSKQRYETMKKYRERIQRGVDLIAGLGETIRSGNYAAVLDASAPEYSIRPMGLLASGFLVSDNAAANNELLLSWWYINEMYLGINDIKSAGSKDEALQAYDALIKALNSYLGLLNRVITAKVGDKWELV
jgi:hypothetical protein